MRVFGVNNLIKLLYQVHKDKKLSIITDYITGEAKGGLSWFGLLGYGKKEELKALDLQLSKWTYADELKLNSLLKEQELMITGVYNEAKGIMEYPNKELNYPKELKDLIAKKEAIIKDENKYRKGDIVTNWNSELQVFEIIDKTAKDEAKVVMLGKKGKKTKNIDNVNKNVS